MIQLKSKCLYFIHYSNDIIKIYLQFSTKTLLGFLGSYLTVFDFKSTDLFIVLYLKIDLFCKKDRYLSIIIISTLL